ncbi:PEP-CTERM sorting domain-containing protein [Nostoc sp. FACHB-280]|uniref:PEP-CTERM sorting domain-containing protein n=1 Tax=Nostoc sp. FACHB-280 TaxID=2692839 RepID=UPI00168B8E70|nr:PEP-CTERM sorting domain-containing protein [Nostoc sp. FACHB-280]MBD2494437.1 PEP-CTERM sorting domain-containing protein [Nostoc sp. FACHB-280]
MKSAKNLGIIFLGMTSAIVITGAYIPRAQAARVNLVQNGDFEIDPLVNPDYDPTVPNPFITGWTNGSVTDIGTYSVRLSNYPNPLTNGLRSVEFNYTAPGTLGSLSQTLATKKNKEYQLSFYLASVEEAPRLDNIFQVFAGGQKLLELTNLTLDIDPLQNFKKYTLNFIAQSTATELKFSGRTGHDWLNLDDVSVYRVSNGNSQGSGNQAVPEPTTIGGIVLAGLVGSWLKRKKAESC